VGHCCFTLHFVHFIQETVHCHKLWPEITTSVDHRAPWAVDLTVAGNWLPSHQFVMGDANAAVAAMSPKQQDHFLNRARSFFLEGTMRLIHYLPFQNATLRSLQFLDPSRRLSKNYVKWATTAAKAFPTIISPSQMDTFTVEARLFVIQVEIAEADRSLSDFWKEVGATNKFPLLVQLARAAMSLPHGNSDVERLFSVLSDVVTKKRNRLQAQSLQALLLVKTYMQARNLSCHSFPISDPLLSLVQGSYRRYAEHKAEKQKKREEECTALREKEIREALALEQQRSTRLQKVQQAEEKVKYLIKLLFKKLINILNSIYFPNFVCIFIQTQQERERLHTELERARQMRADADLLISSKEKQLTDASNVSQQLQEKKDRISRGLLDRVISQVAQSPAGKRPRLI
jgi:hypothetical protein